MRRRIYLVHWNATEAKDKAAILQVAGYNVFYEYPGPAVFREIRKQAPDAFVIDLSRLPSQGRDVALNLRHSKATRHIPIVFVDGDPEKMAGVRKHLPDATYTVWSRIRRSLKTALSNPPLNPVVPRTVLDGYADAPLTKKLGIKAGGQIGLINEPTGFRQLLRTLPHGCVISERPLKKNDLIIWFAMSAAEIENRIGEIVSRLSVKGGLWIAWPKKESGVFSDLSQQVVREFGLDSGLVDYKISSFDETWSGLKFARRKAK